jgi:hypothetical protein
MIFFKIYKKEEYFSTYMQAYITLLISNKKILNIKNFEF